MTQDDIRDRMEELYDFLEEHYSHHEIRQMLRSLPRNAMYDLDQITELYISKRLEQEI